MTQVDLFIPILTHVYGKPSWVAAPALFRISG